MVEHSYFSSMIIVGAADVGMKDGGNFIFFDCADASNGLAVKPVVEDGLDRAVFAQMPSAVSKLSRVRVNQAPSGCPIVASGRHD
jgi:hypothetical protein